jgi:hypothetical protein
MNLHELTNEIYDKIFDLVGLTLHHVPLDISQIEYQYVEGKKGEIYIQYSDKAFLITVTEIPIRHDIEDET